MGVNQILDYHPVGNFRAVDRSAGGAVTRNFRDQLALFGGNVLWQLVGVAVGAIGYAAEAAFELEMHRVALRNQVQGR